MTLEDDETYDLAAGPDEATIPDDEIGTEDTEGRDDERVPGSPPTGVANAHLGTSGRPAQNILSAEELAQTEVTGGAGLSTDALTGEHDAGGSHGPSSRSD